jgi:hypothetical protein
MYSHPPSVLDRDLQSELFKSSLSTKPSARHQGPIDPIAIMTKNDAWHVGDPYSVCMSMDQG